MLLAFRDKTLTTPKYDNLSNFPANSFDFPTLFHFQGLGFVIANCGPFYPDLVKTFYCNLFTEHGYVVKYFVKGKDIVLTKEDFGKCLSIPFEGERICQGFTCDWTDCEKNKYYFSISRLSEHGIFTNKARNYVRASNWIIVYSLNLSVIDRMLYYFIAYILMSKHSNHSQINDTKMKVIYVVKNKWKVNWSYLTMHHMIHQKGMTGGLPYARLITKILEFCQVDLEGEAKVKMTSK